MSMHLLPVYYTTTRYGKKSKKRKLTKRMAKINQEHEKFLKKMGVNKVDVSGKATERIANPSYAGSNPVIHSKYYNQLPTSDKIPGNGNKKDTIKYTGTNILGIATMHKSNMVPITNKQAAKDIAKMRRQ